MNPVEYDPESGKHFIRCGANTVTVEYVQIEPDPEHRARIYDQWEQRGEWERSTYHGRSGEGWGNVGY